WLARDCRMRRLDHRRASSRQRKMDLGGEGEGVAMACVLNTHGPAAGLNSAELDSGIGERVATILVENQVGGLEVDGILEFFRSRLIRAGGPRRVSFKVDLHLAFGRDVARFRIVQEIIAGDLVETGSIATVENNVDLVQFSAPVHFEFFHRPGSDGKERTPALGLGKLEATGGLLDTVPHLSRHFVEHVTLARPGKKIHSGDHRTEQYGAPYEPAAQTRGGARHGSSLIQTDAGDRTTVLPILGGVCG